MKRIFILFAAVTGLLVSCKKDDHNDKGGTFKGPEMQIHDGKAWTWIELDRQGNPTQLAVSVTDAALNSMPVDSTGEGGDHEDMENSWELTFHPKASIVPFKFLGMGWNPSGHPPMEIYGKPHFDFHFYMMTPSEVAAIPPYEADSTKFKNAPAADYLPANYFNAGGGVPQMGAHWVDVTSSEFNGQPFTQTFLYGSYDGKVTFYEPMITLAFLKSATSFERSIPQPSKVQKSGWYPTKLKITKHDGLTDVIVTGFVYRTQS